MQWALEQLALDPHQRTLYQALYHLGPCNWVLTMRRKALICVREKTMHLNNSSFALSMKRVANPAVLFGLILVLGLITSCSKQTPSNEQLQQQAQQATERARQESQKALADARAAAARAEGQVNAITSGVKQGMQEKSGNSAPGSRVNLNTASESDLAALPGISNAKARQIIRRRPYRSAHQLVERGLLSQSQFDRIAADVTAR
jgi:DNA uptake protein ComE-like DNA-binding protein